MEIGIDVQGMLAPGGAGSQLTSLAARIADAGLDFVNFGDHISFRDGTGFDGMINAMAMLASHPDLPVQIGGYQLPARHPVLVARQVASIAELAPGRLVLACGVGGDDRNEIAMVGVDPSTRGRRADEALDLLRSLLRGNRMDHDGEFFDFEDALIRPAPDPPVPLLVAGRSDASLARAARSGDGWLAIWVSPDRFAKAVETISRLSTGHRGDGFQWQHGLSVWCGFDDDQRSGEDHLRVAMERLYGLSFERFAKWCPSGTPAEVAESLRAYAAAGCRRVVIIPAGLAADEAISVTAEVRAHLRADTS